jgi:hypothetical protein
VDLLTKGDNNHVDDRALYHRGQLWLQRHHIVGRAKAFLPYIGMVTIMMNDYRKALHANSSPAEMGRHWPAGPFCPHRERGIRMIN